MTVSELKVELPENLSQDEAKLFLALKLYEVGKVSLNQAAKLADYSKRGFLEILARYRIPVFNYSAEDLRQELLES
jgi:predicted HTH domain antitoxin